MFHLHHNQDTNLKTTSQLKPEACFTSEVFRRDRVTKGSMRNRIKIGGGLAAVFPCKVLVIHASCTDLRSPSVVNIPADCVAQAVTAPKIIVLSLTVLQHSHASIASIYMRPMQSSCSGSASPD